MNLFGKRPLALFCAAFAASSVGGLCLTLKHLEFHIPLACLLFLSAALLIAVPLFRNRFHPRCLTPVLALLFAALALLESHFFVGSKLSRISDVEGQTVACKFQIKEKYFAKSYLSSYRAELSSLDGNPLKTGATVTLPFDAEWQIGDVVEGTFTAHAVSDGSENTLYRLADGIFLDLETEEESFSVVGNIEPDRLTSALSDFRESLAILICTHVEGEEGNLVSSLFLNKRELLSDKTTLAFRRTGTTHLLAISGMHLSIVILMVELLLRALGIQKKPRCVIILLLAFGYLSLTGFALSACRAFLMCTFVYLAWLFRSDNDAVTSLFFALFFLLAISPYSVCDIGLWMSFLAVLGILVAIRLLDKLRERLQKKGMEKKRLRRLLRVLSAICISLAAEIFLLFPMWLVFDELSLMALPCGLLLSPLVTAVLVLTPLFLLVSGIPVLIALLGKLLYAVCHILLTLVSSFSSLRGITVSLGYRFFDFLIPLSAIVIAILLLVKLKKLRWIPIAMGGTVLALTLFLLVLRLPPPDAVTADFLCQGENELLVFSMSEESIICDSTSGSSTLLRTAYDLLHERRATEISAYLLTHYHSRHISTLSRLFSAFTVRSLYLPLPKNEDESSICASLLTLAKEHGLMAVIYDREKPLVFEPLSLTVSDTSYLKRSTQPIYTISASAFGKEILYIGESAAEDQALYDALCERTKSADLILFGAHGPITKQPFSYPLGNGHVFLADESILPYFTLQDTPTGKIICGGSHFSFVMPRLRSELVTSIC